MVLADIWGFGSTHIGDWTSLIGVLEGGGAFIAGYVLARRHNCHVKGCWRIGRRPVPGTTYIVCHTHNPHAQPSHQDVIDAHDAAKAASATALPVTTTGPMDS